MPGQRGGVQCSAVGLGDDVLGGGRYLTRVVERSVVYARGGGGQNGRRSP